MQPMHRAPLRLIAYLMFFAALLATLRAEAVDLWGRWQGTFQSANPVAAETALMVDFVAPSGATTRATGFWDGGSTWRVRFMPTETGRWRYLTHSVPVVEGLDKRSGEFTCERSSIANRFLQHGPLQVSATGRFLEHRDGTPFLWIGDTVWYGAILSSAADWESYLIDREYKRFDVVHFNVVAPRNGLAADENGEISFSGGKRFQSESVVGRLLVHALEYTGLNDTPVRINPRFYQRLDERVDAVNAHGLLAAIVLTWARFPEDSGSSLPEDQLIRLIRYLVSRYQAHDVVWILTGDNAYDGASKERWTRIGRTVFAQMPQHAPVTTHPIGMSWPWDGFRAEAWLNFVIYQSGHGDDAKALHWIHSGPPSEHWPEPPPRPFINIEPPYEGHLGYQSHRPHTDYSVRRAIYWSLLNAPTAGVSYGAHGVWSWQTTVGQTPADHPTTGIAKTWREALSFPGSTQMMYLEEFLSSIPWWRLQPDRNLLIEQPGADDPARYVAASRSQEGDLAVIYLPVGGLVKVKAHLLREGLRAQWFDPRTGKRVLALDKRENEFLAPDARDWVLLLN